LYLLKTIYDIPGFGVPYIPDSTGNRKLVIETGYIYTTFSKDVLFIYVVVAKGDQPPDVIIRERSFKTQ
jgi:hypothetical protein